MIDLNNVRFESDYLDNDFAIITGDPVKPCALRDRWAELLCEVENIENGYGAFLGEDNCHGPDHDAERCEALERSLEEAEADLAEFEHGELAPRIEKALAHKDDEYVTWDEIEAETP